MKKRLLFLISLVILSCNTDETSNPDRTALDLVTGINCRQTTDDIPLQLGNPNILINNKFVIYPNPVTDVFYLAAQENVTDVWLVSGNPQKIYQTTNFSSVLNTNLYSEQSILDNSDFSLTGQSSSGISINIGTLEEGYYKVFVKIGGVIYWDNIYKHGDQGDNEEQFNELFDFWN